MRIHHLNCGSHCPIGGAFYDGRSRGLVANLCTHCLLLELNDCLVLVDTGYGLGDLPGQPRRLALTWLLLLRPRLREADTAFRQVEAFGYDPRDVRHIVLTHLDFDHAGGIEDFPRATIHVMAAEKDAAERHRRGFVARQRYRPLGRTGLMPRSFASFRSKFLCPSMTHLRIKSSRRRSRIMTANPRSG